MSKSDTLQSSPDNQKTGRPDAKEIEKLLVVRDGHDGDTPFILSTWRTSFYYGNDRFEDSYFRGVDHDSFFDGYLKVTKAILARPGISIVVACLKADPNVIVSYAVLEKAASGVLLHWIYTKRDWRKLGIARYLLPDLSQVKFVTHLSKIGRSIKPKDWKFDPFAA